MNNLLNCALRFLARREHSAYELSVKLAHKGYHSDEVETVIMECQRLGYQSDERYAQLMCQTRIRQGYGPLRIKQELQAMHVESSLIESMLGQQASTWLEHAKAIIQKKYDNHGELTFTALQKQKQFLLRRGFPSDVIAQVLNYDVVIK